jgi:hypothetical protein
MRARFYNSQTGRFINEDTIGLGGGVNLYAYVHNDPIHRVDPFGLTDIKTDPLQPPLDTQTPPSIPSGCSAVALNFINCMIKSEITDFARDKLVKKGFSLMVVGGCTNPELGSIAGTVCIAGVLYKIVDTPLEILQCNEEAYTERESCEYQKNLKLTLPHSCEGLSSATCTPAGLPPSTPHTFTIKVGHAVDPNGKITVGYGDQGFVPPDATITYTIYFENQPSATLPAQKVVVADPLDSNLDWSAVQLTQIGFNNVTLNVPAGVQSYSGQASVSTDPNPVSISASLDPSSGTLIWTFQSIDPTTGGIPQNPLAGFLPPDNASRSGEGFVVFTVKPKSGVANGTTIYNQASIVFDMNTAIQTNKVTNTIDSIYPTSSVDPLPATTTSASFAVSWSGTDPSGAGIATYDIFVATDNGPYTSWLLHTTSTTATFNGSLGHSYSFYSLATDNVGYRQQTPGPIQTTTVAAVTISGVTVNPSTVTLGGSATLTVQLSASAPMGGVTVNLTSSNQAAFPVPATLTVPAGQNSASISIQSGSVSTSTLVSITATYNGSPQQTQVTVNPAQQAPVVTVTPSLFSITTTQVLSVTVIVSGRAGSPTPTGTVVLTSGGYTSGSATLTNGSAVIGIPAGSLGVGSDILNANYTPDTSSSSIYTAASGSAASPVIVSKATPTVTFTGAPSNAGYKTQFTVASTTNASSAATIAATGACSIAGNLVTMSSGTGTCTLTANWAADNVYASATAGQTTTATAINPTVTFAGAPLTAVYHTQFAVNSTTNASTTALITAAGACSIAGNTVTMTSGTGNCSLAARWAADNNYSAATAAQSTMALKAASTTGIIANTPNPSSPGQTVTVSFQSGGVTVPSGAVTVSASTGESCTGILSSGAGNCSLAFAMAGSRTLTASYVGDNNFNGSTSTAVTQTVGATGPLAVLSPTSLNFGDVYLHMAAVRTVTLTNAGNAPMSVGKVQVAGGNDPNDFIPVRLCPSALGAGMSCKIVVTLTADSDNYSPTGILTVEDNAPGSPQMIPVAGTMINPVAGLSSVALNFGKQKVNTTSAAQTVRLTNKGTTPLILSSLTVNGDFGLSSGTTCLDGSNLAPAASCLISVTFTPIAKGPRTGNVIVKDNALLREQVIVLFGTGN